MGIDRTPRQENKPETDNAEIFSMIEKKAYEIFRKRSSRHGDDLADWLKAEKEVLKELGLM